MGISKCVTTKVENKTRKYWLFSTFFILALYSLVDLAICASLSLSSIPKEDFVRCPVTVVIGMIQTIFLWHCAYRNHGTKLLSFYLVALPLLLMISMADSVINFCDTDKTTASDFSKAYGTTTLVIYLSGFFWWLVLSLKMKNINKAIQERMLEKNFMELSISKS